MTEEEKQELQDEKKYLQMLHQIYLETEELGFTPEERVEHLLDIMERIFEIGKLLNE